MSSKIVKNLSREVSKSLAKSSKIVKKIIFLDSKIFANLREKTIYLPYLLYFGIFGGYLLYLGIFRIFILFRDIYSILGYLVYFGKIYI
jgi:hypothetical protein